MTHLHPDTSTIRGPGLISSHINTDFVMVSGALDVGKLVPELLQNGLILRA
nr:hypothetical protein [uncultured Rhodoferax sp.]